MHGDHIGGLTAEDGTPTFANASYVTGQAEFDHWAAQNNEGFEAKVRPLADRFTFIGDEGEVAPGITGMAAFGHTPGHMVYRLDSGDRQVLLMADLANHYVWSVAYPDWEVRFDADKAAAAAVAPPHPRHGGGRADAGHRLPHALPGHGLHRHARGRVPLRADQLPDDAGLTVASSRLALRRRAAP
jgi:glyoxylase-like metal-dependent hydrolase (beta-lactamase superfamily II)